MKKFLFGLVSVYIVLASCKKEHSKDLGPSKATHQIVFNVGFSKSIVDFATGKLKVNSLKDNATDTALTNNVKVLYYAVYDSSGNSVHTIQQLSTDAAFGSYTDHLASGTYTLIVAAGGDSLKISSDTYGELVRSLGLDVLSYGFSDNVEAPRWYAFNGDTFCKKITLNVSNTDATQNISLDRITSKLVINIEDALPANAKTIYVSCNPSYKYYVGLNLPSSHHTYNDYSITVPVPAGLAGTTNYKVSMILLTGTPFNVEISCSSTPPPTNLSGTPTPVIIADKVINNVAGQANKVTLLSGSLFGGATTHSTGGFTVSVDTAWNATPITKSF